MLVERKFTCPAFWPRSTEYSVLYPDAHLDVAYSVWHNDEHSLPKAPEPRLNIVLMHGSQFTRELWNYVIELAFKELGTVLDKCVTIDAVTHGDSAVLNAGKVDFYSGWDDVGRDAGQVIKLLRETGEIKGPVVLYGHSMGASASLILAAHDPALVQGLVLGDPVWGGITTELAHSKVPMRLSNAVYSRAKDTFESYESYRKFMSTKHFSSTLHEHIKKDVIANCAYQASDGRWRMKQSRALQAGSYYSVKSVVSMGNTLFRYVTQPVLIVHGDIDDWNPKGSNELLQSVLPNAERIRVGGGGHLIQFQKPEECFSQTLPFLRRISEQARLTAKYVPYSLSPDKNFEHMLHSASVQSKQPKL